MPTRRQFLAGAASVAAASLAFPAILRSQAARRAADRPNVLFIPVDDLRPQLACYGHRQMITPNMDALTASGALFERAYCQQAVCAPSRISLLTGCRPDTTKIYDLQSPLQEDAPHLVSLNRTFRDAGYETVSLGKIYHHPGDDRAGWTARPRIERPPEHHEPAHLEAMGAAQRQRDADAATQAATLPAGTTRPAPRPVRGPAYDAADVGDDAYPDGVLANAAIEQLRRLKQQRDADGTPFFLASGFWKPHLPFSCPKKYWERYDPDSIDLADNPFRPAGAPDIAMHNWGELRQYLGIPKGNEDMDEATKRKLVHGYYACVTYMDAQLGKLLAAVDELRLRDNTIICLWGDHGYHLGDHDLWCKHSNFENAVHVPLIFSGPGVPAGVRTGALTEFVDIFPTLCEIADVATPRDQLEGTSVVPLLRDPSRAWKSAAFSQYPRPGNVMGYSVRTDRYRFTRWQKRGGDRAVVATELYDHQIDPQENTNLAADATHAPLVTELSKVIDDGWRAARPSA